MEGEKDEGEEVRNIKAWYRNIKEKKRDNEQSDSNGEVVCRRSRHVGFDPNNPIPHLEFGMVFRGLEEFKTASIKYAKLAKEELKVELSSGTCSRARKQALKEINGRSIPSLAGVPSAAPALPAHSQIVAFEASASSPPTPSTQPTPPIMPTSSTQKILTRLRSRENKLCKGLGYTPMRGYGSQYER
ncbi:hypothetical protein GOBAR_AA12671 [Gossypium barbadense]|uniref:Uncharacterized protein n=1 Tax=Gossypium barbadense TaxID=3634 RepID=A0A2P5XX89_GOSBA|nr:hypothetical protein GOBAR_AA12671 [Gossypium barbadense]